MRLHTALLLALCLTLLPWNLAHAASADYVFAQSQAGKILLQAESHGQAWYVNPDTLLRHYLKDGAEAYRLMRYFGKGLDEAAFAKLQSGDRTLLNRFKGRIVLRVQAKGEAYYIKPQDLSVHYLKDGAEAYRLMRLHSLGITDQSLERILVGKLATADDTRIENTSPTRNRKLAETYYWKGFSIWTGTKDYATAESWYLKALQSDPDFAPALSSYGYIRGAFHDEYDRGEMFLMRAMQLDPTWGYAPFNLGLLYDLKMLHYRLEHPGEQADAVLDALHTDAIRWLQFTVDRFPNHPDIAHFRSQLAGTKAY